MLHNTYVREATPRHVRDIYLARLYRASADMNAFPQFDHTQDGLPDASRYLTSLPRVRPRGDDGRFVPRAEDELPVDTRERKICGWCRTSSTSQWRVGPTHGSVEMGTLCNACGINYRRALTKSPDGTLDLDRLAQQMGHTRLSIQKALKRQRKLSAPPNHQFKLSRTNGRVNLSTRPAERYPLMNRLPLTGSQSSVNMLLSQDIDPLEPRMNVRRCLPMDNHGFDASLYSPLPHSNSLTSYQSVTPPVACTPLNYAAPTTVVNGQEYGSMSSHSLYSNCTSERTTVGGSLQTGCRLPDDQSPLPPFQSFIGDLQRRSPM